MIIAHSDSEAITKFEAANPAIVMFSVNSDPADMIELYCHISQDRDWSLRPARIITGKYEELGNWAETNKERYKGIDVHINKPYDPREILSFMERIFANFRDGRFTS